MKGSPYPVVTNLFGTKRRIDLAFGPKPEAIVRELVQVAESLLPPRPSELWKHRSIGREILRQISSEADRDKSKPLSKSVLGGQKSPPRLRRRT